MGKASRKKQLKRYEKQPVDRTKLSDAILHICEYYFSFNETLKKSEFEKIVSMAIIGWNIAVMPEEERADAVAEFVKSQPGMQEELQADIEKMEKLGDVLPDVLPDDELSIGSITLQILTNMIMRKYELYPNEKAVITDFVVKENTTGFGLNINAFLPKESVNFIGHL